MDYQITVQIIPLVFVKVKIQPTHEESQQPIYLPSASRKIGGKEYFEEEKLSSTFRPTLELSSLEESQNNNSTRSLLVPSLSGARRERRKSKLHEDSLILSSANAFRFFLSPRPSRNAEEDRKYMEMKADIRLNGVGDHVGLIEEDVVRTNVYLVDSSQLIPCILKLGNNLTLMDNIAEVRQIYFDNESRYAYHAMLGLRDGAKTVRMEQSNKDWTKVTVKQTTHFLDSKNVEKDFTIEKDAVKSLLKGQPVAVDPLSKADMCTDVQKLVSQLALLPAVKVTMNRMFFQSTDHDHISITVDFNNKFIRENPRDLNFTVDPSRLGLGDVISFPYAVVTVTLREPFVSSPPAFLTELKDVCFHQMDELDTYSPYVQALYEFSMSTQPDGDDSDELSAPPWWSITENDAITPLGLQAQLKDLKKRRNVMERAHWFTRLFHLYDSERKIKNAKRLMKVSFACERTFLSWLSTATFSAALGIAISGISGQRDAGGLLLLNSVVTISYSTMTYYIRASHIHSENRNVKLYDLYGPPLIALLSITTFLTSFLIIVRIL
jgi:uncharacterized membrane protein YidH (DUF202 family)